MTPPDLLNLLLLLTITAGHLAIVRDAIGRCYRVALPKPLWAIVAGGLLVIGVAVPWAMFQHVGLHGPRLLRGGPWWGAPPGWQLYGALCVAALTASAAARVRWRTSTALVAQTSGTIDIARRLDAPPAGPGVRGWIARAPRNDLFRVEVAERQIALAGLPPDWDGLSILHLTDLHFNGTPSLPFFQHACELAGGLKPDLVALTGDVLDRHARADWLPTTLQTLHAPLGCYFVLGNHDAQDDPQKIRAALTAIGWTDVGGRAHLQPMSGGDPLLIAGSERPWLGVDPEIPTTPAGLRVLLSHTPEQFAWAQSRGIDLVLAGHLHGGQIDLPVFGPLSGGRYHAGVFAAGPTAMHVSRGLGAIFPLRWNCPAEITKLVLRSRGGR